MTINALSLITAQSNRKPYKFDIPNSLRFRNNLDSYSSSSYFHKVFSTTQTDKTKWTISYWWKGVYNSGIIPGSLPTYNTNYYGFLCLSGTNGGTTTIADTSWYGYSGCSGSDCTAEIGVRLGAKGASWGWYGYVAGPTTIVNQDFRDNKWYHFVINYDLNRTAGDQVRVYCNGILTGSTQYQGNFSNSVVSNSGATYEAHWAKSGWRTSIGLEATYLHGNWGSNAYPYRLDGYMSELHSFDGDVLEPNNFGRTDKYGNWVPKKVTNTNYGNNGFYLDFSDVTDIGADRSGNNNHFTPSGFDTTITTDTVTNIATSTGTDYLSGASYSGTWSPIETTDAQRKSNAEDAFDSSLGSYFVGACAATTGVTQSCTSNKVLSTVTLGSAISVSSSLRVYYSPFNNSGYYFAINGTLYGTGSGGATWITVPSITSITSIGIHGSGQSDNCCSASGMYAIEVDGVILKSNDTEYTLTFNTGTSISSFSRGDIVYQSSSVYGTVLSVDSGNKKITLGLVTGTFATDQTVYKSIAEQDNYFNYDYMNDSPTNEYATWDTLTPHSTTSHGGLNITNQRNCTTTFGKFKTGKYYFEWNATQGGYIGVTDNIDSWGNNTTPFAHSDDSLGYYAANQKVYRNSSTGVTYGSSPIQSGVLAMAVDFDNGSIEYFHNGGSLGYATTVTSALTSGKEYYIAGQGLDTTNDIKTNFGQQPFRHTPPAGFVGLNRKTLSAQKFIDGTDHFRTILVDATTGTTTSGAVTNVTDNGGKNWSISGYVSLDNSVSYYMDPDNELDAILLNERNSEFQSTYPSNFYTYPNVRVTFTFSPALENSSARFYAYCDWACTSLHTVARPQYNGTSFDMSHNSIVTKSGTTSSVSFYTKPWTAPYSASISQVGNIQSNGSYDVFVDNQIVLTFANSSDVTGFAAGQLVYKQGNTAVRGKVESVNSASSPYTITIRSNGTWGNGDVLQNTNILNEAKTIFPSGLWWIKDRQNLNQHQLIDSVRANDKALTSPTLDVNGEITYASPSGNSVAWCWNYNSSNPSINGFEIITYTGNDTADRQISHNLGSEPEFIITKQIDGSQQFMCYHKNLGVNYAIDLNLTSGSYSWSAYKGVSSTNYTIGGNGTQVNDDTKDYVSYLWTSVPGYSAFGKYNSNNNSDGPVIITGFNPSFLLVKRTTTEHWQIIDSTRNISNPTNSVLQPSATSIDYTNSVNNVDFLSNGFKIRNTGGPFNSSTNEYIYAAFAEKPVFAKNFSSVNAR